MKIFTDIDDLSWIFNQPDSNGTSLTDRDNKKIAYSFTALGNNRFAFILEGTSHLIHIIRENGIYHVHLEGEYFPVSVEDERIRELKKLVENVSENQGEEKILAPIPGLIGKVSVKEGDEVKQGEGLIILEAMKMENEIHADRDGTIKKILINERDSVEKDQVLLILA
jgi:biotin carboxyl carrier protein